MADYILQAMWVDGAANMERDSGSGANDDVTMVIPRLPDPSWSFLGMRAIGGHTDDEGRHMIVRPHPDTFEEPLAEVLGYDYVWGMTHHGMNEAPKFGLWRARTPDGFVTLGDIWATNDGVNYAHKQRAVAASCVVSCPIGGRIWCDQGSGADDDGSIWAVEDGFGTSYRYMLAQQGYDQPGGTAHMLDMSKVELIA